MDNDTDSDVSSNPNETRIAILMVMRMIPASQMTNGTLVTARFTRYS
jgi:hypothetical protein